MSQKKENKGQFKPGNTIGMETRFKKGHQLSCKYKAEYAEDIRTFFESSEDLVLIEDWAKARHLHINTVKGWAANPEKYHQFVLNYEQAMADQCAKLIKGGLKGAYNARLVEFLLKNNHGMTDKAMTDTTVTFNVAYGSSDIDEESN